MRKGKLLLMATFILCVLLFAERITGVIWHAVFGVILMITMAVHVARCHEQCKNQRTPVRAVDVVLMVSLIVLCLTGVLYHPLQEMLVVKIVHKFAAVIFLFGIVIHAVQHRRSIQR